MPQPRFYQVLRGARGEAAKAKFLDHLRGLGQGENIGTKGNRPPSIALYLTPFDLPLGANLLVKASALVPSHDMFKNGSEYSSRVKTVLGGTETSIKLRSYAAPRIVRRQLSSTTGTAKTSKLTGLKYLHYNTQSASVPFGKKTGDTSLISVFEDIVTQAKGSATNLTFTLLEEHV